MSRDEAEEMMDEFVAAYDRACAPCITGDRFRTDLAKLDDVRRKIVDALCEKD